MKENTREISVLKQRILQFLDLKGISKYECYKNTGITNGVFSQSNGMSEDNLLKFLSYYPEISLEWLFYGKGQMILAQLEPEIEPIVAKQTFSSERATIYYEMLKEKESAYNELLKENGRMEERIRQLENNQIEEKSTDKNSSTSYKPKGNVVGSVIAPSKSLKKR